MPGGLGALNMLLRPYQTAAVSAVHSHWAAGTLRVCLALPTGAGKTKTAMSALQGARNPLALVHTTTLADQARAALAAAGLRGTVSTIQAAVRRGVSLAAHDVVWIDECFVKGTQVKPIGKIIALSSRPAPDTLVEIDGVVSTPNHPYLTPEGWKRAEDVKPGDLLLRPSNTNRQQRKASQNLRPLLLQGSSETKGALPILHLVREGSTKAFTGHVFQTMSIEDIERDHVLHQQASRVCKATRSKQHDSPAGRKEETFQHTQSDWPQAETARRERPWAYVAGIPTRESYWVEGPQRQNRRRISASTLQVGPSRAINKSLHRGRRREPRFAEGAAGRQTQGTLVETTRVGSVEIHERGGRGRYSEVCPDGLVYNLETESGLYFAGNRLVHNCHHIRSTSWGRVMGLLAPGARVLGVTATPERADGAALGDVFDALVATAPYSTLLRDGHLVPCRITPATNMAPETAYLAHGNGRPGILFAPTKAECNAAVQALCAAGVPSATIDADTPTKHRRAIIADYNAGHVQLLASPVALAEGFDATRAEVVVLGRTCGHVGLYLQCVGRVLRPHPGKTEAHLIDLVGAADRHGSPTQDRTYSLEGRAISGPLSRLDAALEGVSGMLGDTGDGPRRPAARVPVGVRVPDRVAAGVRRSRPAAVPPTRPTKPARVPFWQKVAYSVGAGRWLW